MDISCIIRVKILMFIERSYRGPPIVFTVEPRMVIIFELTIQSLVNTCLSWRQN